MRKLWVSSISPISSLKAMLKTGFFAATVAAVSSTAWASSPQAWAEHEREVVDACVKASGLKNARPAGTFMVYDDSVGKTALLVTGRYPQPHMKNRSGQVLCLFDRQKHQAAVVEADQLSVKTSPPATGKK